MKVKKYFHLLTFRPIGCNEGKKVLSWSEIRSGARDEGKKVLSFAHIPAYGCDEGEKVLSFVRNPILSPQRR